METHGCGWWIEIGEEAMVAALRTGLRTSAELLDKMGRRGERWVREAFSWSHIGQEMARVYNWLCGCESMPECVKLD